MHQAGPVISKHGLDALGASMPGNASFRLNNLGNVYWNLQVPALYEEALRRNEGVLAAGGPLCVLTGVHTGRSPNDKFFVREPGSESKIDWGKTNKPIEREKFEGLLARMMAYAQRRDLFVRECYGGADPAHRIKVRVINETAAQPLRHEHVPASADAGSRRFRARLHHPAAAGFQAILEIDGTNSDCAIICDFGRRLVAICAPGTPARSRSRCSPS